MRIEITVTDEELDEMDLTTEELKSRVIEDLDEAHDYSSYDVFVTVED